MKPEIVQMSEADYHNDPVGISLSASIASILLTQSAEHAWLAHPKLGGKPFKPSAEMDFGTLGHSVLLRSNDKRIKVPVAAEDIYVGSGKKRELRLRAGEAFRDWKLGAAQDARDEIRAAGGVPVLQSTIDEAAEMAEAARRKFKPSWLIANPERHKVEHVILWEETASNGMKVPCRARLDIASLQSGLMEDLKVVASSHPKAARKHVENYGAHIQYGAYTSALEHAIPELAGRTQYRWVFVESAAPYAVLRARPAGSMRTLGEALWRTAVDRWSECLQTGEWPGYDATEVELEASPYAMAELIEMEAGREAA